MHKLNFALIVYTNDMMKHLIGCKYGNRISPNLTIHAFYQF